MSEEYVTKEKLNITLNGRNFYFTIDGWTSLDNVDDVTSTAHLIDPAS